MVCARLAFAFYRISIIVLRDNHLHLQYTLHSNDIHVSRKKHNDIDFDL